MAGAGEETLPAGVPGAAGGGGAAAALPCALYALLALLVFPVYPHFVSPNEFSRWLTAAAVVDRGTVDVSSLLPLVGPRFEDLSEAGGVVSPNKAPGLAFLSLPGYLAARPLAGPPSAAQMRPALTAMRLAGATLPLVLLGLAFARAGRRTGATAERAAFTTGVLLFATPLLAWGLLLFAHALAAACLFGAWSLLLLPRPGPGAGRDVAAGALLGLAAATEYPLLVPAVLLWGLASSEGPRGAVRAARIALGGLPFGLLLALYHRACFGGAFELPMAHERFERFRLLRGTGLLGIGFPSLSRLCSLLFDPSKGLLVLTPVLVVALLALPACLRGLPARAAWGLVLVPASLLVVYSGFADWHGGWGVGARYLAPALPFLVFPLARLRGARLEALLAGASFAGVAPLALSFPFVPEGIPAPWASFALPILAGGRAAPNLLHLLGAPRAVAVCVPLALAALGLLSVLKGRRLAAAAGAGAMLALPALLFFVAPLSPPLAVQRGYVEEVYLGKEGAIAGSLPAGMAPPARLLRRRDLETALPPLPWPF
jgi:hypothetical protein